MSTPNPFTPFRAAKRPAKILLFGEPGTEKTRRALMQMPHPIAYIDMEASAAAYGALATPEDAILVTRRLRGRGSVLEALAYIEERPKEFASVVIDPITTVWEQIQAAFRERLAVRQQRKNPGIQAEDVIIEPGHWNALNTTHGDLIARLLSLPQHVLLIGRGKFLKDENSGQVNGYDFEGWKRVPSLVSTVIETHPEWDAVHKDRFGVFREGRHPRIDLSALFHRETEAVKVEGESEAARADADTAADARQKAIDHLIDRGLLQEALEQFGESEKWDEEVLENLRRWLREKHPTPKGSAPATGGRSSGAGGGGRSTTGRTREPGEEG